MPIRRADRDDIGGIKRVAERSWEHDYPDILSRESIETGVNEWYGRDRLSTVVELDDSFVFVADREGEVVGFAHGVLTEGAGAVLRVYVDPAHRGDGLGTDLLDRTVEAMTADGAERVTATVLSANEPGLQFYLDAGFTELDERGETRIGDEFYEETTLELRGG